MGIVNRKIIDYMTTYTHLLDHDDAVLEWIKEGYEPFGAPFVYKTKNDENIIIQAMVMYEK